MSKRSLIGIFLTTGLFAGALLWFILASPVSSSCEPLVVTKPSPQRSWVAQRLYGCDGYVEFSLRRAETQYLRSSYSFVSFYPGDYSVDLLFKWLSESALLIAIPQGNDRVYWPTQFRALKKPDELHGVQLYYETYPSNPDLAQDAASQLIVRKQAPFDYRFRAIKRGIDVSVGCALDLTVIDGEYFDNLLVNVSAWKTRAHSEYSRKDYSTVVTVPERSLAAIEISVHRKIGNFTSDPTAAAFRVDTSG
jgi:hypothetical protein